MLDSHDHDEHIRALALTGKCAEEIYESLTQREMRRAGDGDVSLEVNLHLVHNTNGTTEEALVEASPTTEQKELLDRLSPQQVRSTDLAGEKVQAILTRAPGNGAPIGGLKVVTESGWFAARPSGTEDIYEIYAESFRGADHLRRILEEAQAMVNDALAATPDRSGKS